MRDLRDPSELGRLLLKGRPHHADPKQRRRALDGLRWLSAEYDYIADTLDRLVPDYSANLTPHQKYGDPRTLPSTMP